MARRTKQDADATRSRLLDAAELVFYEKGVSRASLNDIASAAGLTRGAIYWHFKDKGDLFNAMMERVTSPLKEATCEISTMGCCTPLQRLRGRVDWVQRCITHDERMGRVFEIALFRVEYVDEMTVARDRHVQECRAFQDQLEADLCAAAADEGVALSQGPRVAVIGLRAVFEGLMHSWLLNREEFDLQAASGAAVDTYLRGLGFRF